MDSVACYSAVVYYSLNLDDNQKQDCLLRGVVWSVFEGRHGQIDWLKTVSLNIVVVGFLGLFCYVVFADVCKTFRWVSKIDDDSIMFHYPATHMPIWTHIVCISAKVLKGKTRVICYMKCVVFHIDINLLTKDTQ